MSGGLYWTGYTTIVRKEVTRILRIWGQTIVPPAITMTSRPVACPTGQAVPNGPRTPITSPFSRPHIAVVTSPTARTVCTRR